MNIHGSRIDRWLLHVPRLLFDPPEIGLFKYRGRWRVRYGDTEVTHAMSYGTACDYAQMFKGKVEPTP